MELGRPRVAVPRLRLTALPSKRMAKAEELLRARGWRRAASKQQREAEERATPTQHHTSSELGLTRRQNERVRANS